MKTFIRIAISVIEHDPDGDVHREVGETCFRSLAGQNAPTVLLGDVFRLFGVNHRKVLQLGETGGLES
ncbi:hypothetical protein BHYA_0006g00850 [Botrytis hyacinthi]|uniref:Uncharacterized protein n=1 Tax=Botrytis hyacinthi TaxID=278943 RepID=A0A4Z1H5D9_9HELO|nr:hypothetical protein BHYA_0006g00850 [Botrytis hyacinthi]